MSAKVTLIGAALALIANGFHLHSMYVIKVNPIAPGDTLIMRAVVQTIVFGLWSAVSALRSKTSTDPSSSYNSSSLRESMVRDWKIWALAVVCCFGMAIVILLTFITIEMLPLCDFVVFSFTAPIFTMIFSYFILSKRITILSFLFAFVIVMGAGMVAQPTFIFGIENPIHKETYAGGVTLAIVIAMISGFCRVLIAKCSRVLQSSHFMLMGGLAALILGLFAPLAKIQSNVLHPISFFEEPNMKFGLASGVESTLSALLLLLATKYTDNPVLVSVVRTTEITMGLILDMIMPTSALILDTGSMMFWYKVIGATIVTVSVMGISLSDKIYDRLLECVGRPNRCHYAEIGTPSEDDECSSLSECSRLRQYS